VDGKSGAVIRNFFAFNPNFTGGVYVATGDINGDCWSDIVVGADAVGGPNVIVYSGRTGALLANFFAYSPDFTGGVRVAAGDVDGDGFADIITGAGHGRRGPTSPLMSSRRLRDSGLSFFAFPSTFLGGVFVSVGDVNNDGTPDIIASTGADTNTPTEVTAFSGKSLASPTILDDFFPFGLNFTGGSQHRGQGSVFGDLNNIVAAAGPGGGPGSGGVPAQCRQHDNRT